MSGTKMTVNHYGEPTKIIIKTLVAPQWRRKFQKSINFLNNWCMSEIFNYRLDDWYLRGAEAISSGRDDDGETGGFIRWGTWKSILASKEAKKQRMLTTTFNKSQMKDIVKEFKKTVDYCIEKSNGVNKFVLFKMFKGFGGQGALPQRKRLNFSSRMRRPVDYMYSTLTVRRICECGCRMANTIERVKMMEGSKEHWLARQEENIKWEGMAILMEHPNTQMLPEDVIVLIGEFLAY
tara:strand:- start:15904 stop:16611 length:708 start_codon:yes stop_codon:yes gene_type:complete